MAVSPLGGANDEVSDYYSIWAIAFTNYDRPTDYPTARASINRA
ncbi:hypothetical protein [Tolypothrix sp. NIES-4075]|nr:hypothetical protein [Tolypothrix sp. NIES-4075]